VLVSVLVGVCACWCLECSLSLVVVLTPLLCFGWFLVCRFEERASGSSYIVF
jgi:hypothetical protein